MLRVSGGFLQPAGSREEGRGFSSPHALPHWLMTPGVSPPSGTGGELQISPAPPAVLKRSNWSLGREGSGFVALGSLQLVTDTLLFSLRIFKWFLLVFFFFKSNYTK